MTAGPSAADNMSEYIFSFLIFFLLSLFAAALLVDSDVEPFCAAPSGRTTFNVFFLP